MQKKTNIELNRIGIEQFKEAEKIPLLVVLDNVRSLSNIGSIFRTSDAFKIQSIYLCGITATPPHREIQKTALGATESVNWQYFQHTQEAIHQLKKEGYKIVAIEQAQNSIELQKYPIDKVQPIAVIFGNEVDGVEDSIMELIDECIEIPQYGTKHSLNISVSAGIVIWDLFNKMSNLLNA